MTKQLTGAVWIGCVMWALALNSCAETGEIVDAKTTATNNPYAWIGEAHNEGLSAVINCLEANRNEIRDEAELLAAADMGIKRYFSEKYGIIPDQAALRHSYDLAMSKSRVDRLGKNSSGVSLVDSLMRSGVYTDGELSFLGRLRNLRHGAITPQAYDDSINAINRDACDQLGEKGAEKILVQTSIARSSYHYWTAHANRWLDLMSGFGGKAFRKTSSVLGDSVFDGYVDNVVETDYVAAGAAIIPCAFSTIGWTWCVMGAALGASTVYALWHYPYYPW